MSVILLRSAKGSPLTHTEMDTNWTNLNNDKFEKSTYSSNNTIVYKSNSGVLTELVVPASRVVGRKSTGEITVLQASDIITLLGGSLTSLIPQRIEVLNVTLSITLTALIGVPIEKVKVEANSQLQLPGNLTSYDILTGTILFSSTLGSVTAYVEIWP